METTRDPGDSGRGDLHPPALKRLVKGAAGGAVLLLALYGASVPLIEGATPMAGSAMLHTVAAIVGGLGGALLAYRA